jgi:hypothetical protein
MIARLIAAGMRSVNQRLSLWRRPSTLAKAVLKDGPSVSASARPDELSRRIPVKKGFSAPASTRSFPLDPVPHRCRNSGRPYPRGACRAGNRRSHEAKTASGMARLLRRTAPPRLTIQRRAGYVVHNRPLRTAVSLRQCRAVCPVGRRAVSVRDLSAIRGVVPGAAEGATLMPPMIPCGRAPRDCPAPKGFLFVAASRLCSFVAGGPGRHGRLRAGFRTFPPAPPNGEVRTFRYVPTSLKSRVPATRPEFPEWPLSDFREFDRVGPRRVRHQRRKVR